jgi:signal transduction histidine kinase
MSIIGRKSRAPDGTAADLTAPFLLAAMLWITAAFLYAAHGDLALTGLLSAIGLATVVYAVRPLVRQKSQQQPAANAPDIAILDTTLGPLDAGFMMFDDTDHLVYVNEAARRIFPKARDAMVPGAYFEDILRAGVNRGAVPAAADDPEAWIADRVDRHLNPPGPFTMQLETGARVRGREHRLDNGWIVACYAAAELVETSARDNQSPITGPLRETLASLGGSLNEAIDTLPQAFALFDRDQCLVIANARFKGLFPSFAERIRPGLTFQNFAESEARSGLIADAIGEESRWIQERCARFTRADGVLRQMTIGGRTLETGEYTLKDGGVALIHHDVTEQARTEKELLTAKDAAELADRAKSQFLANMSHELRTPLNAVIGFAEVLRDELFGPLGDPQYQDFVADIHDSGQHLLEMIDDILDLSKMEVGQRELNAVPMDISRTIGSAIRMVRQRAERAQVDVSADTSDGIPPFSGEERGIKQVLLNLLSNAIKFTPEGGEISVVTQPSADGGLVITVTDNGLGMPRGEIELAFAPFVQLDSTHSKHYEGSGLGLPLVKSLVEMHGGTVRIESELDQGTSVILHFPAERMVRNLAV